MARTKKTVRPRPRIRISLVKKTPTKPRPAQVRKNGRVRTVKVRHWQKKNELLKRYQYDISVVDLVFEAKCDSCGGDIGFGLFKKMKYTNNPERIYVTGKKFDIAFLCEKCQHRIVKEMVDHNEIILKYGRIVYNFDL